MQAAIESGQEVPRQGAFWIALDVLRLPDGPPVDRMEWRPVHEQAMILFGQLLEILPISGLVLVACGILTYFVMWATGCAIGEGCSLPIFSYDRMTWYGGCNLPLAKSGHAMDLRS